MIERSSIDNALRNEIETGRKGPGMNTSNLTEKRMLTETLLSYLANEFGETRTSAIALELAVSGLQICIRSGLAVSQYQAEIMARVPGQNAENWLEQRAMIKREDYETGLEEIDHG